MNLPLMIAINELGIMEIPGPESNARIDEYLQTVGQPGDDEIPWCAAYGCWCLEKSGIRSPRSPLARSFLKWGIKLDKPRPGCIVVLKRGIYSWQGHMGFYLNSVDSAGTHFYLLSANDRNTVRVSPFSESRILGYRWHPDMLKHHIRKVSYEAEDTQ